MSKKYKCNDCNEEFTLTDDKKCPNCKSLNIKESIENKIPMFFGMNPPMEDAHCEGGTCTFDKK